MDITTAFGGLMDTILSVLPTSPFAGVVNAFARSPYLAYLNWFFPVSECIALCEVWLAAIALFYIYSVIMRWVKLIGD